MLRASRIAVNGTPAALTGLKGDHRQAHVVRLSAGEKEQEKSNCETSDFADGIISELIRANQESFYKGQRVADAKERNRARLAQGVMQGLRPYTRQTPGWLRWS